jgi:phosphatidylinositol alpha-1,6-mannosyltransferase
VQLNNSSFSSAAAHGLPIVTTIEGAAERQFVDGVNTILCPPKSPEKLAAAITALVDDRGLRERLGEGAFALSEQWYSWDRAMDRTVEILGGSARA